MKCSHRSRSDLRRRKCSSCSMNLFVCPSVSGWIVEAFIIFVNDLREDLEKAMASASSDEQLAFLISCIRQSDNGKLDFAAVRN